MTASTAQTETTDTSLNPSRNATSTPSLDAAAVAVTRARKAQATWGAWSVERRVEALRPLAGKVLSRADEIAKLVSREMGKPEAEALLAEVLPTADVLAFWCDEIGALLEDHEIDLDPLTFTGKAASITREPRGVVALITPWNYPIALPLRTIVPALLAGNAVVMKPSEVTPECGELLGKILAELLPADVFTVLAGDGKLGAALVDADVDLVVFTGSVATGRKVAHACAERFIPCSLELGGKDPALVLADCDLERTARGVVWGALTNAGQNCAAIERVYVEASIADAFLAKVREEVTALSPAEIGRLATDAQYQVVQRHLADAKAKGAQVVVEGKRPDDADARWMPPTVVSLEDESTSLIQDETFGPVIPIIKVADVDDAVQRANKSRFGLTASVWSKSRKRALAVAKRLRAGVVTINNHAFTGAVPMLPWTGVGESGYGVTNSMFALDMLTRPRALLVDRGLGKREVWWYPYTPVLSALARAFITVRGGGGLFARIGAVFKLLGLLPKRLAGK
jgi:acyl-CoA reductase-like NAD-dependent aldehyde dehydrogenase